MVHPKVRVILFLVLLNLPWLVVTWWWGRVPESLWLVAVALSINVLWFSYDFVLSFSGLEPTRTTALEGRDPWGLNNLVANLANRTGQGPPKIEEIDHATAQVFGYSRPGGATRLFVTRGLLELLSSAELKEVIAVEMGTFQSSRARLNYWAGALIDPVWRIASFTEKACDILFGQAPRIAAMITKPWALFVTKALLGSTNRRVPTREEGDSATFDSAQWKMGAYAETRPWKEAWVIAHMCRVDPVRRGRRPQIRLPGVPL